MPDTCAHAASMHGGAGCEAFDREEPRAALHMCPCPLDDLAARRAGCGSLG